MKDLNMVLTQINLSQKDMETILFQLQNSVFKIYDINNKFVGLGFLIKLKANNNEKFFLMINSNIKDTINYILLKEPNQKKKINN